MGEPNEDAGGCMAILVSVCLAGALWLGGYVIGVAIVKAAFR